MPSTRRERRGGRNRPRSVKEAAPKPPEEPEEVLTEDEIAGLEAVAKEGRDDLERLPDLPDPVGLRTLDRDVYVKDTSAETIAAAVAEHGIPDVEISPEGMEKLVQSGQAARIPSEDPEPIKVAVLDTGQDPPQTESIEEAIAQAREDAIERTKDIWGIDSTPRNLYTIVVPEDMYIEQHGRVIVIRKKE